MTIVALLLTLWIVLCWLGVVGVVVEAAGSTATMLVDEEQVVDGSEHETAEVRSTLDDEQSDELPPQPLLLLQLFDAAEAA